MQLVQEWAQSTIDMRQIGRPAKFRGKDYTELRSWYFVFLAYCGAVAPIMQKEIMDATTAAPADSVLNRHTDTLATKQRSMSLYYRLVMLMEEAGLKKLEHVGEGEGYRASRKLHDDYEPSTGERRAGKLVQLMTKTFGSGSGPSASWRASRCSATAGKLRVVRFSPMSCGSR